MNLNGITEASLLGRTSSLSRRRRRTKPADRRGRQIYGLETLEPRAMLAGDFAISEFVASNSIGLKDQDNEFSDWIEIHNTTTIPKSLNGWYLTDSANKPTKWTFPDVTLPADGYLVVFASGKDRATAGAQLHTNFSLDADGEYLGLLEPDGVTVASEYAPKFPPQIKDVSYGNSSTVTTTSLVASGATGLLKVPTNGDMALDWTTANFDDSAWSTVTTPLGFDANQSAQSKVSYGINAGATGTYTFGGMLGADFVVNTAILVTSLGVFDSGGNGLVGTLRAQLYSRSGDTGNKLAEVTFDAASPGTLKGGNRFKPLASPLVLQPGTYTIAAYGYSTNDRAGDEFSGGPSGGQKTYDTDNGAITFENVSRSGATVNAFPPNKFNGFKNYYSGASFEFGKPGYTSLASTNIDAAMRNVGTSAYLRELFQVADATALHDLSLNVRYDDGFVAYLNGTKIASRNAPDPAVWNSVAPIDRTLQQAVTFESINVSQFANLLTNGTNILAIHGLNNSLADPDFFLDVQLVDTQTLPPSGHFFATPTPGTANSALDFAFVEDTKFDHDHGFYDQSFDVSITTATPGAQIRYTTDGSDPTATTGTIYTAPVHIAGTTTLRAAAFKSGMTPTNIDTQTYIFLNDVIVQSPTGTPPPGFPASGLNGQQMDYGMDPDIVNSPTYGPLLKNALKSLPTISIVTPTANLFNQQTGIYVNPGQHGSAWERPASVELINPDGTDGFQIDAGLRIRGGYSRSGDNPKHALRLFFGDDIAKDGKLNYPLFGDEGVDHFNTVDLRTAQNYSWSFGGDASNTMIVDDFARYTQAAMDDPYSRSRWVHVYLDGQYWGVYEFQERTENSFGEDYFGGDSNNYDVIKVDTTTGYNIEATDGNTAAWQSLWNLANSVAAASTQAQRLALYMQAQGLNPDGTRNLAYPVLLDVENLIDYMELNFWGGNNDAPVSAFLSNQSPNNWYGMRDRTGTEGFRFFAHDSEHLMRPFNNVPALLIDRTDPWSAGQVFAKSSPQWIHQQLMFSDEYRLKFSDHVQRDFFDTGVFAPTVAKARYLGHMPVIDQAMIAESARWGDAKTSTPLTRDNWVAAVNNHANSYFPTRTDNVLGQFRTTTLFTGVNGATNGPAAPLYPTGVNVPTFTVNGVAKHGGLITAGSTLALAAAGTPIYYTLDGSDPRLIGGATSPSALLYSNSLAINDTVHVMARSRTAAGVWSPLEDVVFANDASALRITEIMYNPAAPPVGSIYTASDFEFIELQNTGATAFDLEGVKFTQGLDFTFGNRVIAPGERVVIVRNPTAFATRYPGITPVGTFTTDLDNGGQPLRLETALDVQLLDFSYSDGWYSITDGEGYSLVIINPAASAASWDLKQSWRPSQFLGGNPTAADAGINPLSVVINEVLTNPTQAGGDKIELYNSSAAAVDISGWYLSDLDLIPADLQKYKIPAGTIIPAGGYLVIDEATFNSANPGTNVPFELSRGGESVFLSSADAQGNLGGYRHQEDFAAADAGISFGRYTKSTGGVDFVAMASTTFGAANVGPKVGPIVINEVQYAPSAVGDEFIELLNISGAAVPLFDPTHPDNAWKFTNGVDFTFPTHADAVTLPAGGYALVVAIDPAAFRTKYSIPAAIPIFGPYAGALSGSGESLELSKPGEPLPDTSVPYVLVEKVNYSPDAPWPTQPAFGYSLSRLVPTNYSNEPANWIAGNFGGTPGRLNTPLDVSPPSVPTGLTATMFNGTRADLAWTASSDPQTGILKYVIYRGGVEIGQSTTNSFSDLTVKAGVTYSYQVSAINNDSIESAKSTATTFRILGLSGVSNPDKTHVRVVFTEGVQPSAANLSNYSIPGLTISAAVLAADNVTVTLTTSTMVDDTNYTLSVTGINSLSGNPTAPNLQASFTAGLGTGLRGEYYDEQNFTVLRVVRTDPTVDFEWGEGSPDPLIGPNQFSVRWTGSVRPLFSETYTFTTRTDDGVRLWVNDVQIINQFVDQGPTNVNGTITLLAGQRYAIRMEYYENGGGAVAHLSWSSPSQVSQIIPSSQLFPPPNVTIADLSKDEGNSGTTNFQFTVSLSSPLSIPVTVFYNTVAGTALAGSDYTTASGSIVFPANTISQVINVSVVGDTVSEGNEQFTVSLTSATNAVITDNLAVGTIVDDDLTSVVGRNLFYNRSVFDGDDPAASTADDDAISGKTALPPGQLATFANYSSYSRGINGLMVDIKTPTGTPSASDFSFRTGNDNTPSQWATLGITPTVSVRQIGASNVSRVTLIFPDDAIRNTWLQVTVKSGGGIGLSSPDVFYFGNAVGETGNTPGDATVNASDEIATRNNPRSFMNTAPVSFAYDFNRDGFVNAADQIIARSNPSGLGAALQLITPAAGFSGLQSANLAVVAVAAAIAQSDADRDEQSLQLVTSAPVDAVDEKAAQQFYADFSADEISTNGASPRSKVAFAADHDDLLDAELLDALAAGSGVK